MTEPDETQRGGHEKRSGVSPVLSPMAVVASLPPSALLALNILRDGDKYLSLVLAIIVGLILGVDLTRFIRPGGDR